MAYPKKCRLRQITVDGILYRWRVRGGDLEGTLVIYGPDSSGTALKIHSNSWFDLWLSFSMGNRTRPLAVKPALVREAILFGLSHGWNPQLRGITQVFEYHDGESGNSKAED